MSSQSNLSDPRLKTAIELLDDVDSLDFIRGIEPFRYELTPAARELLNEPLNPTYIGVSTDELTGFPELIWRMAVEQGPDDPYLACDYQRLTIPLIGAVKAVDGAVGSFQGQIDDLEDRISDLEDRVEALENSQPLVFSGTTNSSGQYAVTFSSAFGTPPNVQGTIIGGGNSFTLQMIRSTTGFTATVTQRTSLTVLGIQLLSAAASPVNGATVDVLVTPID